MKKIKKFEELRTKFLNVIAHRLGTPLSAVKWNLEALLDKRIGKLDSYQEEHVKQIYESINRLISILRDLLMAMEIEKGVSLKLEEVDLEKIINQVISGLESVAKLRNISLEFRKAGKELPKVKVDQEKIKHCLFALIDNAIKYNKVKGKVQIQARKKGNEILVSIKDTGIGIPKKEQKNIFKSFFRGSIATTLYTEGTGIGLYMVKAFIKAHKGKIWFESKEGKGATFYFTLPIK